MNGTLFSNVCLPYDGYIKPLSVTIMSTLHHGQCTTNHQAAHIVTIVCPTGKTIWRFMTSCPTGKTIWRLMTSSPVNEFPLFASDH